jgi:hypothetical protein
MPKKNTGVTDHGHLLVILLVCIFFTLALVPAFADEGTGTGTDTGTEMPTEIPTEAPTEAPVQVTMDFPTDVPTEAPTEIPTEIPTELPTEIPAEEITAETTQSPTEEPTEAPTEEPTEEPVQVAPEDPPQSPLVEPTVEITPEATETPASTGGGFNQAAFDLAVASNPDPPLNDTKVGGSYVDPMYVPTPGYWNITTPDTYYFDKDYTGGNKLTGLWGVWIQVSGVILNGNGNTLEGSHSGTGVIVSDPNGGQLQNVGIYNLALEKWDVGIQMLNVLNGIIDHVTVDNGDNYGIIVKDSKDIKIQDVTITDLHGSSGGQGSNDEQFAGIWVDNSQNVLVNHSSISDISGTSSEPIKGISVTYSNNTQLLYNKIHHIAGTGSKDAPGTGIYNYKSNFSTIYCNNISDISGAGNDFTYGIRMVDSRNGTVTRNHIDEIKGNNGIGMSFESVTNTSVENNRVNRSSYANMYLKDASDNSFSWNWFVQKNTGASDTALNARMDGTNTNNAWAANYWQIATSGKYGFSETCTDADNDGFCDETYQVDQDSSPDPDNFEQHALKNATLLDTDCPGCPKPTPTTTVTPFETPTPTVTATPTPTTTVTPTPTSTATPTPTTTVTPFETPTPTVTATPTPTTTVTPTPTSTATPTPTTTVTPFETPTPTLTIPFTPFETPSVTETPTQPDTPEQVLPTLTFPDLDLCCNATWINVTPNYTAPRFIEPGYRFWVNATVWNTCEACWLPNSTWLAAFNEDARLFGPELIPLNREVCGGQTYPFRFLLTAPINHPGDHTLRYQLLFNNTTWCGEVLELEINVTGPWQQNQRVPEKTYMKSTVPGHFSLAPTKAADTAFAISEFAASKLPSTARFMNEAGSSQIKTPNGEFGPVATLSAMVTSFRSHVGFIPTPSFNFKDLIRLRN